MKKEALLIIFFIVLSFIFTYPLMLNIQTMVFGEPKDALVTVWHYWWQAQAREQNQSDLVVSVIGAPYGVDFRGYPYYPIWNFITSNMSRIFGAIPAYNIQIILGFILSGLFMYWLILRFTLNRMAALISGMIFTLSPYHLAHAFEHLGLSNMQWMVLFLISLFNVRRKPTYINAIICGACFAVIGFFDYYYLYYMSIFSAVFFVFSIFFYRRTIFSRLKERFKYILTGMISAGLLLFPCLWHIIKALFVKSIATTGPVIADFSRPFGQLFADSACLLNYFLPPVFHPVLGYITRPFVGTFLYGDNPPEQTLYLGFVGIILSLICIKKTRAKRGKLQLEYINSEDNFIVSFFMFACIIFTIFSFPPYIYLWKLMVPFPSFFLYPIFPMFRNYARMGVLVLISVCVLSGFGVKYILEQINDSNKKRLGVLAIAIIVFFEFIPFPPVKIIDATQIPSVYMWLKAQEGNFIVAEYPIDADERPYLFQQRIHEKRLVNGAHKATNAYSVTEKLMDLERQTTPGILGFLGVKYVLVHKDKYLNYEGGTILGRVPDLSNNPGFKFIKDFGDTVVYEVNSKPIDPDTVTIEQKSIMLDPEHLQESEKPLNMSFKFKQGDVFSYKVKYLGIFPLINLKIKLQENKTMPEHQTMLIQANASVGPFAAHFFKAKAQLESVFDINDFYNYKYNESIQTGKKLKEKQAVFNRQNNVMITKDRQVSIQPYTQDPISVIFYLSSQEFLPGKEIEVYINPGKSNYLLELIVDKQKEMCIDSQAYKCWELKGEIFKAKDVNKKIADITLWFNVMDKQELIKLEVKTKAGLVTLEK